jgi:hypothetical protein
MQETVNLFSVALASLSSYPHGYTKILIFLSFEALIAYMKMAELTLLTQFEPSSPL